MVTVKLDVRHKQGQYFEDQYLPLINYALSYGYVFEDGSQTRETPFRTDKGAVTRCSLYGSMTAQFIREHILLDDVVHIQEHQGLIAFSLHDPRFQLEIYFYDVKNLDDDQ